MDAIIITCSPLSIQPPAGEDFYNSLTEELILQRIAVEMGLTERNSPKLVAELFKLMMI